MYAVKYSTFYLRSQKYCQSQTKIYGKIKCVRKCSVFVATVTNFLSYDEGSCLTNYRDIMLNELFSVYQIL